MSFETGQRRAEDGLDLLTSPAGRALLDRLDGTDVSATDELRLASALRREFPAELVTAALGQHELRVRARAKFSRAGRMFFTRDGLEQASAEPVAAHRAGRFAAAGRVRVADLCCGIGGDLVALAGAGADVRGVDLDPVHLRMATLNAAAYDVAGAVDTSRADVRDADLDGMDAAFVDPARRAGGRRLRTGDSEPPLDWCLALTARTPHVAVKAAPGLDRSLVPSGWETEFVADGRELKEAVIWSPAFATGKATRATVLPGGHQLLPSPGDPVPCRPPGPYLLDPSPAVTRAGLVEELARELGAWKIDPRIAFLSAEHPPHTPFGRTLRVLDDGPWREKELPARLRAHRIGPLDIRRRGLAGDVDALRRRLKTTGDRPGVLVMTRVNDRPWALLCEPVAGRS
ncbi:class I SAM-dependent methyltransferase [Pseudonocardia acaciae]|uniref:class I SAM-dependent methyltransferase n=1 Tax=Pseudonocardia acaciae TaxID=551276 RepID=UPI00055BC36D|nr:class I SAM-dependent methyltransferase [Pseudonocardia acaciae]